MLTDTPITGQPNARLMVQRPNPLDFKSALGYTGKGNAWANMGPRFNGGGVKPPGLAKPPGTPAAPPAQWTFQPNPMDQAPTAPGQPAVAPGGAGSASGNNPWSIAPPTQPWMNNPMGGGYGGYPQMPPAFLSFLQAQMGGGQSPYGIQQPYTGGPMPPYNPSQPPQQPPQTGGPLPPYNPQQSYGWGQY